ncbi:pro-MCH 2-like [Myxocyprinus asiaticus]|uniref:pro-MCH 2-like n=1 Tax=Myxocyprinus asiaticus TaxID=70543 RepID=UPI002221A394|nr:pro-MCH 2-like [Myxocyprinus asiaticus]
MASSFSIILAFALLVEFTTHSAMAFPKGKLDEDRIAQDLSNAGEDDVSELGPGLLSLRRYPVIEGRLADEDGTKRIFILANTGIKGSTGREANFAFPRAFPVLPLREMDHALDEFSVRDERRSTGDVDRKNIDLLRCMIGRVYRPCWQA